MRRSALIAAAVSFVTAACSLHSGRLHVLGRDYQKNGSAVSLTEAQHSSGSALVVVDHGHVVTGNVGSYAPTMIYVEDGDRFTPYALEGGP